MNQIVYKDIVDKYKKKNKWLHNYLVSFISGGLIGAFSQIIYIVFIKFTNISSTNVKGIITLLLIGVTALLTALGIFDNLIKKFRSGLIIPTTGFAHSVTSSSIDFKKDGLITGLGSNFFHLAGSVILYSVVGSFILIILKVIISA
ncbi:MAG: SpoVA/SpoVAEb family sporulation membrane protein [Bacilli bacterium]|nr:SpoVA/SpoVAEb family sporulation membrane protein [Bacilli bacterium]